MAYAWHLHMHTHWLWVCRPCCNNNNMHGICMACRNFQNQGTCTSSACTKMCDAKEGMVKQLWIAFICQVKRLHLFIIHEILHVAL